MPLFYQQDINETTRLGIWKIEEIESFFLNTVPVQNQITHPHKRLQHLAGRFLLPTLFHDFPHHEIEIADTRKPFLPEEQYHFSISHCGDYAAAIVSSTNRVGIDIELITPKVARVKDKFLHAEELAFVDTIDTQKQLPLLTLLWSAKEAMYKWWGSGDVDFSEALRIAPFEFRQSGILQSAFLRDDLSTALLVHYQMRDEISMAWIAGH